MKICLRLLSCSLGEGQLLGNIKVMFFGNSTIKLNKVQVRGGKKDFLITHPDTKVFGTQGGKIYGSTTQSFRYEC